MFKSDRCGIETSYRVRRRHQYVAFKSDRCGIETALNSSYSCCDISSNQTVAGLKHESRPYMANELDCSNQTVAGLKRMEELEMSLVWGVQIRPLRD